MEKIKLRWSSLNAWKRGDKDQAIKSMMGIPTYSNAKMDTGREIHEIIANQKLKLLPFLSDNAIYEDQTKGTNHFVVTVFDWLDFSGTVDVIDIENKLIVDWKTGSYSSKTYSKMQLYVYAYCLGLMGIEINKAILAKVKTDPIELEGYTIYKITDKHKAEAKEFIESLASEIYYELKG